MIVCIHWSRFFLETETLSKVWQVVHRWLKIVSPSAYSTVKVGVDAANGVIRGGSVAVGIAVGRGVGELHAAMVLTRLITRMTQASQFIRLGTVTPL